MKLLHVLQSANPAGGGVVEAVKQFAIAHRREGHVVEIVSLDAPDAPWVVDGSLGVRAFGRGSKGYGYSPDFVPWLRHARSDYDAVIVNGIWQYNGYAVRLALRGSSTPYVVFPHGMLDPWFRRRYPLKHLKKAIYWRLVEYRVLRDSRLVVFTCEEERRLARESFRPYGFREGVANLGVAIPSGDPAQQRAAFHARIPDLEGKRLLLFLGRLHEKKGCDLLINALSKVATEYASMDPGFHLVMAGPCGNATYLTELKKLAASCFPGRVPPITWTGMLDGDVKWGAYRAAEAFVLPSHQENFGLSVVEALSCGLPVLISNKVNIWREIDEDHAGYVESDDLDGTMRLLQCWISTKLESNRSIRAAALRCFRSRFEISHAAGHLAELLRHVASPGSASAATQAPVAMSIAAIPSK